MLAVDISPGVWQAWQAASSADGHVSPYAAAHAVMEKCPGPITQAWNRLKRISDAGEEYGNVRLWTTCLMDLTESQENLHLKQDWKKLPDTLRQLRWLRHWKAEANKYMNLLGEASRNQRQYARLLMDIIQEHTGDSAELTAKTLDVYIAEMEQEKEEHV